MARRFPGRSTRSLIRSRANSKLILKAAAPAVMPLELLEQRQLLSVAPVTVTPCVTVIPDASGSSDITGYTPVADSHRIRIQQRQLQRASVATVRVRRSRSSMRTTTPTSNRI